MKEQILQILLRIASGEAIAQGEKTVYPAVREQLAAIKAIMTLQGWDRKETKKKAVAPAEIPLEATADTTIMGLLWEKLLFRENRNLQQVRM